MTHMSVFPLLDLFPELLVYLARSCAPRERTALRATCKALYAADPRYYIPRQISVLLREMELPALAHDAAIMKQSWLALGDSHPFQWDLFAKEERYRISFGGTIGLYLPPRNTRFSEFSRKIHPSTDWIFSARVIRGRQILYFSMTLKLRAPPDGWVMRVGEGGCSYEKLAVSDPDLGTCLARGLDHWPLFKAYLEEEHVQAHPSHPGTFRVVRPVPLPPEAAPDPDARTHPPQ
jgi:hypothetical protein